MACRRQCKARGHLDWRALQPVADKKHRPAVGASQHDPPAPASNAPSFSVVSSVADSVFGGGASRRARIAEVLNIICQEIGTISLLGAAGRLHGGHAASGWNGIYLASESPGPARVFRERGGSEGPS